MKPTIKQRLSTSATIILLAVVYFYSAKFGLSLAFLHKSATAVWPPTGIALAALLLLGYEVWPGIAIGAFLVNLMTEGTLFTSLGIAIGNTLEALLGASLANRYAKGIHAFDRARNVFKFIILSGIVSTSVSATIGTLSLALYGSVPWGKYGPIWLTWWLGDMASAFKIAPLIIIWATSPFPKLSIKRGFETLFLLFLILVVGQIVFLGWFPSEITNYPLEYFDIPILLYAAFRFGQRGAISAAFIMSVVAIWGTLHGSGPFAVANRNTSLLLLQAFMGTVSVTGLVVASVISENKRIEKILRKKEGIEKFRAVTETANDAIVLGDSKGKIIYFNKAAKQIFGYQTEEIIGQSLTLLMPDRYHQAHLQGLKRFLKTRVSKIMGTPLELVGKNRDGTEFPLELSLASWETDGEVFFSATIRDITRQKNADEALERKNVFVLLLQVVAVAANQAQSIEEAFQIALDEICSHLGWLLGHGYVVDPETPDMVFPTGIWHCSDPGRFEKFQRLSEALPMAKGVGLPGRVLETGSPEWIKTLADNPTFPRSELAKELGIKTSFAFPVLLEKEVIGVLEFFSDKTAEPDEPLLEIMAHIGVQIGHVVERVRAKKALQKAHDELEMKVAERTQELRAANERLTKLDELKSHFILVASHELRTPLTSIKGYILLILQGKVGPLTDTQREFLTHVKKAAEQLQRLLSELLNISKIESGQVSMHMQPVNMEELLREQVMIFKAEADQKSILLQLTCENELENVRCDADQMREVISNLISNALKFTPKNGEVRILAKRFKEKIEIRVKDNGIGIKPKDQLKIFDPFHHVHKTGLEGEESTGLGLALTKRIVEAHLGKIQVESEEGKGSVFTVTLPTKN